MKVEENQAEKPSELLLKAQHAAGVPNEIASVLVAQAAALSALQGRTVAEDLEMAIHMLEQIKPEGALQSMLAVQMIGVHNSAAQVPQEVDG